MEKHTVTQEILLITASSFAQKDLCDKDSENNSIPSRSSEKLEEACWNGLLDELLTNSPQTRKYGKLFIWTIHVSQAFLCVELAQSPEGIEAAFSLDPHMFLKLRNVN